MIEAEDIAQLDSVIAAINEEGVDIEEVRSFESTEHMATKATLKLSW